VNTLSRLWQRLTKGTTNRRIMRAALVIAALSVGIKVFSLAKELFVASRFGVSGKMDAFNIALLVPAFGINVIANSFSTALIPTYIHVREHEGPEAAQRLFSAIIGWSLVLLTVCAALLVAAAPLYLPVMASNFPAEKLALTLRLLVLMSPLMVLAGVANICGAVLNAGEKFALVAVAPLATPLLTIVCLLAGGAWGIYALAGGVVAGALVEMCVLSVALRRTGVSLRPRWHGFEGHLRQVAGQFSPRVAGNVLRSLTGVADNAFAASLPQGSVAALNYGKRIIGTLLNMGNTALGAAIVPYFSKMAAHRDWAGVRRTLQRYLALIFAATLPLAAVFYFASELLVRLLYQRGSFTAQHTALVAQVQAFYALHIPFAVANAFLSRFLTTMLATRVTMWIAAAALVFNVTLDIILIRKIGVAGIALSTSISALMIFVLQLFFARRVLRERAGQ
jgi:putative peptidoglycan lipid II flippase